jgi:TPP-dependent 2-oxoacid decarboxylase
MTAVHYRLNQLETGAYICLYSCCATHTGVCEAVEAASHVITCGAVWTDYSSVGYSLLLQRNKTIRVGAGAPPRANEVTAPHHS